MKDITIFIPVHDISVQAEELYKNAVKSVEEAQKHYDGKLIIKTVVASGFDYPTYMVNPFTNPGESDYCSQINYAVNNNCDTEFFSILEFDDEYSEKWFKCFNDYYVGNEDVSVFLPINIIHDSNDNWQFCNETAWSAGFSDELGFIDHKSLDGFTMFNLTGSIFNTEDFKAIGGFKPSIKVAFNYEFLLRATHKELKVMVVPKNGYLHNVGRKHSLTDIYNETIPAEDITKWFDLAKREFTYMTDRSKTITKDKKVELK